MAILNRFSAILLYCDSTHFFSSRCGMSGDSRPALGIMRFAIRDSVPLRWGGDRQRHRQVNAHTFSKPFVTWSRPQSEFQVINFLSLPRKMWWNFRKFWEWQMLSLFSLGKCERKFATKNPPSFSRSGLGSRSYKGDKIPSFRRHMGGREVTGR